MNEKHFKLLEDREFAMEVYFAQSKDEVKELFSKKGVEFFDHDFQELAKYHYKFFENEKISELLENREFVWSLNSASTEEEVKKLFSEKGVELSDHDFQELSKFFYKILEKASVAKTAGGSGSQTENGSDPLKLFIPDENELDNSNYSSYNNIFNEKSSKSHIASIAGVNAYKWARNRRK